MSLINEALKKAQRMRKEEAAAPGATPAEAGGPIAKRRQPKSANSMFLLAAAAVVLVVLSMVATALWLTRPTPSAPVASVHPAAAAAATEKPGTAPIVVLPAITPIAAPVAKPGPAKASVAAAPVPSAGIASAPSVATAVAGSSAAATSSASTADAHAPEKKIEPPPAPKPDERIQQFVDAIRVAGVRSSGTDSKVLMNDRVYRVNDIVERNLGVRLTAVKADSLTFTDAKGVTYVKFF